MQKMHSEAAGKKGFVPILPARRDASTEPSSSDQANPGKGSPQLPLKRPRKTAGGRFACDACRARKTACNGELPCPACVKRKLKCSFTTRQETGLSHKERVELEELRKDNDQLRKRLATDTTTIENLDTITTAPEDEALAFFHQLRTTGRAKSSAMITAKDIPLPDKESLEFELMMRHPVPYPIPPLQSSMGVPVPEPRTRPKRPSVNVDDEAASTGSVAPSLCFRVF
ncbi:hypothetical protein BD289DRAFT_474202 [Coniella lustricola]|uniref:Zn(2)-C6 fungal-type domain-containing protein n=1 Tax=Coniella lustricola TaxID=2025994 RepID=A0A2T3A8H6_9PEZI|nr:hypothetical protein BD289DRAFT_474202 [Coniella lustricola]